MMSLKAESGMGRRNLRSRFILNKMKDHANCTAIGIKQYAANVMTLLIRQLDGGWGPNP